MVGLKQHSAWLKAVIKWVIPAWKVNGGVFVAKVVVKYCPSGTGPVVTDGGGLQDTFIASMGRCKSSVNHVDWGFLPPGLSRWRSISALQ